MLTASPATSRRRCSRAPRWATGRDGWGEVAQTLVTTDETGFRGALGSLSGGVPAPAGARRRRACRGCAAGGGDARQRRPDLLGVIAVAPRRRRGQEKRLLSMAERAGGGVARARRARPRVRSRFDQSDGLTGVLTRTFFQERLDRALEQAHRQQTPLCVVMVGIDEFRHYNQSQGHEKGDEVLRQLGGCCARPCARGPGRPLGRRGFAIVYRGAAKETALRLADELRQKVAAHRFPDGIYQPGGALSGLLRRGRVPRRTPARRRTWSRCAEAAMSEAKRKGRNAVMAARLRLPGPQCSVTEGEVSHRER